MEKEILAAVVFDCDGVLIESNAVKTQAFGQTVAEFGPEAMEGLMAYHRAHGGISRFKKFEWFYTEVLKTPLSQERMDTLCRRFSDHCMDKVLEAPMVAGARECLDALFHKLPLFVASGAPEPELRKVLEKKELARYFKGICGTPPEKQYRLEQIISENQLVSSQVLMVGDANTDYEAAQYCNTLFYGRGKQFAEMDMPWGHDLTGLLDYISHSFDTTPQLNQN